MSQRMFKSDSALATLSCTSKWLRHISLSVMVRDLDLVSVSIPAQCRLVAQLIRPYQLSSLVRSLTLQLDPHDFEDQEGVAEYLCGWMQLCVWLEQLDMSLDWLAVRSVHLTPLQSLFRRQTQLKRVKLNHRPSSGHSSWEGSVGFCVDGTALARLVSYLPPLTDLHLCGFSVVSNAASLVACLTGVSSLTHFSATLSEVLDSAWHTVPSTCWPCLQSLVLSARYNGGSYGSPLDEREVEALCALLAVVASSLRRLKLGGFWLLKRGQRRLETEGLGFALPELRRLETESLQGGETLERCISASSPHLPPPTYSTRLSGGACLGYK